MRILIATDAFPPISGGSGWSTYELARGLRARGHHLVVVQPYSERDPFADDVRRLRRARAFPRSRRRSRFVRNYFRNERLYERLGVASRARDSQSTASISFTRSTC